VCIPRKYKHLKRYSMAYHLKVCNTNICLQKATSSKTFNTDYKTLWPQKLYLESTSLPTKSTTPGCWKGCSWHAKHTRGAFKMDHSTVVCSVTWPIHVSEAGGGLVVIQTSLLFAYKCKLHKNNLIYKTKAVRSLWKQGHLQPCCHSEARSLNRQL